MELSQLQRRWFNGTSKWLILGSVVGIMTALLGIMLVVACEYGTAFFLHYLSGVDLAHPHGHNPVHFTEDVTFNPWILIVVMTLGGLAVGLLLQYLIQDETSSDTQSMVSHVHEPKSGFSFRFWLARLLAAIITISTGGSVGREGPIVLGGGGTGKWLGLRFQLSSRDKRILMVAGMAGGIAAVFRAPLAGALFAIEVLYRESDIESESLIPAFISAIVAYCFFGILEGLVLPVDESGIVGSLFGIAAPLQFRVSNAWELVGYALVAFVSIIGGRSMQGTVSLSDAGFKRVNLARYWKTAIGGFVVAILVVVWIELNDWFAWGHEQGNILFTHLGAGYGILQVLFDHDANQFSLQFDSVQLGILLFGVAVFKIIATSITVGSGCGGGLYAPSMVVGGCLGACVALIFDGYAIAPPLSACVLMGMAGILTVNYKTPLAAFLMVCEIGGTYDLLIPAMWVTALAFLLGGRKSLVSSQVNTLVQSPAHRGRLFGDITATMKVREVFNPEEDVRMLRPESTMAECKRLITDTQQDIYPVVKEDGDLYGIFTINDLRAFLYDTDLELVVVAEDIASTDIISVAPEDSLATALRRFTTVNAEALPVVSSEDRKIFLGFLHRSAVIAYYNKVVEGLADNRKSPQAEGGARWITKVSVNDE